MCRETTRCGGIPPPRSSTGRTSAPRRTRSTRGRPLRRVRPDAAAARAGPLRDGGPGLARPRSRRPALGTPALLFQHFPVGEDHDFVDDQTALLELMARHDVRGLFAGHVHRETVTRLDGLIQVTLRAVRDEAVFYWADLIAGPALAVSRVAVAGDGAQASVPVATVPLSGRRPPRAAGRAAAPAPGRRGAPAPAMAAPPERVGAGRDRRGRLRRGGRVDRRGHRRVPHRNRLRGPARRLAVAGAARAGVPAARRRPRAPARCSSRPPTGTCTPWTPPPGGSGGGSPRAPRCSASRWR